MLTPTASPAAVGRRLTSAPAMVDMMIGERFPSSGQSSSYSADSINNFASSGLISWQDHDVFSFESSPDPFLPPFQGESSLTMATDQNARRNQNDANPRKESWILDESGNIEIAVRDVKRKRTYRHNEEELHCLLPSFESTSSTRMLTTHPTLKMATARKTKNIGVNITVLQKLVSPFGKTDTASVLHEATLYIESMHERIKLLSKYHLESISYDVVQGINNGFDQRLESLRDMGLCLVPISPLIISFVNHEPLDH